MYIDQCTPEKDVKIFLTLPDMVYETSYRASPISSLHLFSSRSSCHSCVAIFDLVRCPLSVILNCSSSSPLTQGMTTQPQLHAHKLLFYFLATIILDMTRCGLNGESVRARRNIHHLMLRVSCYIFMKNGRNNNTVLYKNITLTLYFRKGSMIA